MTQVVLNAKGQAPTPERVLSVARKCLSLEDGDEAPIPPILIEVLTRFLTNSPGDTNFLLELANRGDPTVGGNGFGLVTCMEDDCWCDLILGSDAAQIDGGRFDGLGSLDAYAVHCATSSHAECRDRRLESQRIIIPKEISASNAHNPLRPSASQLAAPLNAVAGSSRANATSGPSQYRRDTADYPTKQPLTSDPSTRSPFASASSSRVKLEPTSTNSFGSTSNVGSNKAGMSSKVGLDFSSSKRSSGGSTSANAFVLDDDDGSDDDIQFMGSKESKRPKTTAVNDDDDIKPIPSSQYEAKYRPPHVIAWSLMSLGDRMAAVKHELETLRKITPTSPELKSTIKLRKGELKMIEKTFGMKQWTPPTESILHVLPKTAIPEQLRRSFTWPDPPPVSARQVGPIPIPQVSAPLPSYVDALNHWRSLDRNTRRKLSDIERQYLVKVLTQAATALDKIPVVKNLVIDRMMEALRRFNNPDLTPWAPPSPLLLRAFPGLRSLLPESLQRFLPPVNATGAVSSALIGTGGPATYTPVGAGMGLGPVGMPGAFPGLSDLEGFPELDRPQTQQGLTDFFQDALNDFKEDATVDDGLKILKLATIKDMLPGANFTLLAHQVLGVAFMVKREERDSGARGGLLCDAMGLGKTVQTIGIMLARQERPSDYKKAPQLIVAPVALLAQWKAELESKTTTGWKIHIHHGPNRAKTVAGLKQYDIVLTSYGTLRSEAFPKGRKKKKAKRRNPGNSDSDDDTDTEISKTSPLLATKWFRVVLDEAHNIRNKGTSTSKSVMGLDVLHPWFLTGTPVVNSLKDLGPALRFIGAMSLEDFHARVTRIEKQRPKLAAQRTQAILRPLVMRRNKESKINGVQILQLPPKTTNLTSLDFEPDERAIYAALEARAQVRVNKFIQEGTLMKNYSVVLVLLTRLRQCVNHPWLLRRKPGEEANPDDTLVIGDDLLGGNLDKCCANDADEYGRAVGLIGAPKVDLIKRKLEARYRRMTDEDVKPEDEDLECSICYEPFDGSEVVTACQHIYCRTCLDNLFTAPIRDATTLTDEEAQRGCRVCPFCRGTIERGRVFRVAAIYQPPKEAEAIEDNDEDEDIKPQIDKDRKGKKRATGPMDDFFGKGSKLEKTEEQDKQDNEGDAEIEEGIPPSSKMKKLLELVQGYLAEDGTVKIIVFSQFVSFLDLLADFLNLHGIKNIGYRGSMNQGERTEAIRRFAEASTSADSIQVMLISTKAGGVGLNLTMASKVICCDLAWNPATENQAVDRAHRIGQTRPVTVERLVVTDTVENRLLEIQEKKGLLADGAMGEGAVSKIGRLTIDNIRTLFAIDREFERD